MKHYSALFIILLGLTQMSQASQLVPKAVNFVSQNQFLNRVSQTVQQNNTFQKIALSPKAHTVLGLGAFASGLYLTYKSLEALDYNDIQPSYNESTKTKALLLTAGTCALEYWKPENSFLLNLTRGALVPLSFYSNFARYKAAKQSLGVGKGWVMNSATSALLFANSTQNYTPSLWVGEGAATLITTLFTAKEIKERWQKASLLKQPKILSQKQ